MQILINVRQKNKRYCIMALMTNSKAPERVTNWSGVSGNRLMAVETMSSVSYHYLAPPGYILRTLNKV